jgi:hypothetical protein
LVDFIAQRAGEHGCWCYGAMVRWCYGAMVP